MNWSRDSNTVMGLLRFRVCFKHSMGLLRFRVCKVLGLSQSLYTANMHLLPVSCVIKLFAWHISKP
jgi:hypothetical protein